MLVVFDPAGDGQAELMSWTAIGSDDAWLVLDRDGNGTIDNGMEMFGNFTPQDAGIGVGARNGFSALAEFDKAVGGGNSDGRITKQDVIFGELRLWRDTNHNGISEAGELRTLKQTGLAKIDLDYAESDRRDSFGNRFKYRARVKDRNGAQLGRWAWDVFLVRP